MNPTKFLIPCMTLLLMQDTFANKFNSNSPGEAKAFISDIKLDSVHSYYFLSQSDSMFTTKTIYSYNENKMVYLIGQYYIINNEASTSPFYTEELKYNTNNLVELRIISEIDEDRIDYDTILPSVKTEYKYDVNGKLIADWWFEWNYENMQWNEDTAFREEYKYTSEGLNKHTYKIGYGLEGERIPSSTVDYSYNQDPKYTAAVTRLFYNWSDEWGLSDSTLNYYNNENLCSQLVTYWYNSFDNFWMKSLRTEYTYYDNGQLESETNWMYYADTSILTSHIKYTYSDDENSKTQMILSWNNELNDWQKLYRYEYYYSDFSNFSNINSRYAISIYPNPANDFIVLNPHSSDMQINIIDLNGKIVLQAKGTHNSLSIKSLAKGVYVIQVLEGNKILTNRTIIKQ